MLKQLNDKKKTPAKTSSGDSKTPKPIIDKQSNARYLDGLTTTQKPAMDSQYTEEGAKNTGAVTSHYTEALTPVSSPQAPHSQYTNELGTTSQYIDESTRAGASDMLKGNIVSSGYTDGGVVAKPTPTSGYTDGSAESKTSGYTDSLAEKSITSSGYTNDLAVASPNAEKLSRYIQTENNSVPPLVYSAELSTSNGSLYSGTLEYPVAPGQEAPKEKLKDSKDEVKVELKAEPVRSPKGGKHKEHKHKKEDSKSSMKRSKSERTDEKHKKEKKSKKRARSNSHGHKNDHSLALSAPTTPVKQETVAAEKAPDTCPKRKEKEGKVSRESRSASMPEKKFKLALRKSHKSKNKVADIKTSQSTEVIVRPVVVEPTVVSKSTEISPKSPRKDKSSRKSPKADRPVSMPVQPKKEEDLKAIADFYIETGRLTETKEKDKKPKEKREKKKEKKSKRTKSSRSNTATSTELVHANTAPELGRYTSAEELFEINRRLVEGESTTKTAPSPSNINLSSSGSGQNNYVDHFDTIPSLQEPAEDKKVLVAGTSYAASYLTSPPSAAINYIANPNADPGVDVESDSEEPGPETELGYQTAINRKMYAGTSYSNYGAPDDDILNLSETAYGSQALEDIETALETKPIAKVQGPISLSKMALRPQASDMQQSSGSGINWGDEYMRNIHEMAGSKERMIK